MDTKTKTNPQNGALFEQLIGIMARLRDPENGCPWDLKQTTKTIAPYTLEETYEVIDAIEKNDNDGLCEELGDLLFQVIFLAQIAAEQGDFSIADVTHSINEKMIRRHPHIFSDNANLTSADDVVLQWEDIKKLEKKVRPNQSILDDIPLAMGALSRAVKIQQKAAKTGFEWQEVSHIFDKLNEEVNELKAEIENQDHDKIEDELGDVLFVISNIARRLKIDPEQALRRSNQKFTKRFNYIEKAFDFDHEKMKNEIDLETLERYWQEAKKAV